MKDKLIAIGLLLFIALVLLAMAALFMGVSGVYWVGGFVALLAGALACLLWAGMLDE